ncbi:osmotically inducible protein OsmC [Pseudoroseomonas deserti]|uniref:Osmotically inducible protein OsmC n=1 Tax=Teichococcus deserti TaxID=1817963 RepID=A0A1V2H6X9_9PROT|nr:OsmC family protein [Pseudoroseomonas deserti]ONG57338.1 osmotically inducible protein OsmC [Pseudoroseomonas deserti]
MSSLIGYLAQKRDALFRLRERAARPDARPQPLSARVSAEGRSGIRRIRIRDFQLISDSPASFAGYDLGPSSPELQLGVLGSCLTHTFLIQAALLQIPLHRVEVQVDGQIDPRSGQPGFETVPRNPHALRYTVALDSPASEEELAQLHAAVQANCPILHLLRDPQPIDGALARLPAQSDAAE